MPDSKDGKDIVAQNISVVMIREDLDALPEYDIPEGYGLRWYRPGDEEAWVRIHQLADNYNDASLDLYRGQFGEETEVLRKRQCFLTREGDGLVGTATAWFDEDYHGAEFGRIHWVAIVPSEQGKGLSKPLLARACWRLRELGHDRAYLMTSTARVPAINLYLTFGFVPDVRNAEDRDVWRKLRQHVRKEFRGLLPE